MRKKGIAILVMVTGLLFSNAFTSLAAWEQSGAGWKYKDDTTGAYDRNGWYWIDGNSDRIAECYYFDDTEIMAANTVIDLSLIHISGLEVRGLRDARNPAAGGNRSQGYGEEPGRFSAPGQP